MLEILKKSLYDSPVVRKGDYNYVVHPITDGVPEIKPALIRAVVAYIMRIADLDVDKIVTVEAMGIPLGVPLSLALDIPLVIIRKKKYSLPGEIEVSQVTGYSKAQLFLNGIKPKDRVLIVDDVISTGGTVLAVMESLKAAGADVKDIVMVVEKGPGAQRLRTMGYKIKTLVRVEVDETKVTSVTEMA